MTSFSSTLKLCYRSCVFCMMKDSCRHSHPPWWRCVSFFFLLRLFGSESLKMKIISSFIFLCYLEICFDCILKFWLHFTRFTPKSIIEFVICCCKFFCFLLLNSPLELSQWSDLFFPIYSHSNRDKYLLTFSMQIV